MESRGIWFENKAARYIRRRTVGELLCGVSIKYSILDPRNCETVRRNDEFTCGQMLTEKKVSVYSGTRNQTKN